MKKSKFKTLLCGSLLCMCGSMFAQFNVSGRVLTNKGEPLPFATVSLVNSHRVAVAGEDGVFSFKNVSGSVILLIKATGFAQQTDTFDVASDIRKEFMLTASSKQLEEVIVNATRVDNHSGMAFSNVSADEIKKQNLGLDAPYMLNTLPGVVVNSDAGNGVGYTGLRIRGSDGTRINVTINGVPVNDAESQGTFFVNMPDLLSSTDNIQVQRGAGASSNGAGAFGATINFQTNSLNPKANASIVSSAGSFNTFRNTIAVGSGLLNDRFAVDVRGSKITSDGYIDRASSDLSSYYVAAGYYGNKSIIRLINFSGWEKTYQAWYYVPQEMIKHGNRTYNPAGEYLDASGNVKYYPDETDNYNQNNSQLHFIHQFNSRLHLNVTAHYTGGRGYYEQYKSDEPLSAYQLQDVISPKGDTISNSNLVRQLWLDNTFGGGIINIGYTPSSKLNFVLGGGVNNYFGKHFGKVIWSQYASNGEYNHEYYRNAANKNDGNVYLKTNYKVMPELNLFVDLQGRNVSHSFIGFNDSLEVSAQRVNYTFFNPKFGLSYDLSSRLNVYASFARANKEPNRNDFVQSRPGNRPRPEQLNDFEGGVKFRSKKLSMQVNFYRMDYNDQLVLNGQVNDVGAYNRINVDRSYRNGVEIEATFLANRFVTVLGNVALSENRILNYSEYVDSSNADFSVYTQHRKNFENTTIAFSPALVSALVFNLKPFKGFEISLTNKYVGRQYLDNTADLAKSIDPYLVTDLRLNYLVKTKLIPELGLMFSIYNVLDQSYETNGYTYSYFTDATLNTFNYLAPAAAINFLGGVSLKF
jgi:iron complex outermembrane receptor protein